MDIDWTIAGGLVAGAMAGWAARYGRLCTMGAIEDALVAGDYRRLRAWMFAIAVAAALTLAGQHAGLIDVTRALYAGNSLDILGVAVGGITFGLGMALVGTCSFGLIVRAGGGDLRAGLTALILGIVAMALTSGLLAPLRLAVDDLAVVDLSGFGGLRLDRIAAIAFGPIVAGALVAVLLVVPVLTAVRDARLVARPRLMIAASVMGLAVAFGWFASSQAVAALELDRPETLSFVAPVGRAVLEFMMDALRDVGFGIAATAGVLGASLAMAWWSGDLRLEAFDDAYEMQRHAGGAALMAFGGVLAQGCTIGQGLSASSVLAISAPLFVAGVLAGASLGLKYLLDG
ncbi:MAG: YeeE/YedE family protein [Hyphomicrobiaceae bacterium]|nr:YeeE/YedE family protein [Hyphomicrobiaceae bacterium]